GPNFQPSLRDLILFVALPALKRWTIVRHPSGIRSRRGKPISHAKEAKNFVPPHTPEGIVVGRAPRPTPPNANAHCECQMWRAKRAQFQSPGGTRGNSPAFQRRVWVVKPGSPEGTAEPRLAVMRAWGRTFNRPF